MAPYSFISMQHRNFILGFAMLVAFAAFSPAVHAAQPNGLTKFLNDADRALCKTGKVRCKAKPRAARKAKPAKATEETAKPNAAVPVPLPKSKPTPPVAATPKVEAPVAAAPKVKTPVAATPKVKLPVEAAPVPRAKPTAPQKPIEKAAIETPPVVSAPSVDTNCLQELKRIGATFTQPSGNTTQDRCHVVDAVNLRSITSQKNVITLPEAPLLNCKFALQFSKWLDESAAPIVAAKMNKPLDAVATGPGFECRGRNGDDTAKISEHGYGNAVDISTFSLAGGGNIAVQDANDLIGSDAAALRGLRKSACGYFTTVLGPGSNAAHSAHFHIDLGIHGSSGNYRICE